MTTPLLSRKWLIAHVVALALALLFTNLGFWQLRRLDERRLENLVMTARMAEDPTPITDLITAVGNDVSSLANRPATAVGTFRPKDEVLIRSQVFNGTAGYHVITPFQLIEGETLLVNRGWVPLDMDVVPVLAEPPTSQVEISGWVHANAARAGSSAGERPVFNRVDIVAIGGDDVLSVYLVMHGDQSDRLPIPLPPPDVSSEGNHLSYAIQWFSFLLIGIVGYALLLRRALLRTKSQALDDGGTLQSIKD